MCVSFIVIPYIICSTIEDVVKSLNKYVYKCDKFDMVVRRSAVLSDTLRRMDKASFDPAKNEGWFIKYNYCFDAA